PLLTFCYNTHITRRPPASHLFPYTTLFRSCHPHVHHPAKIRREAAALRLAALARLALARPGESDKTEADVRVPEVEVSGESLGRSEEHTSELQSQSNLVCRLLLEKKNNKYN